VGIQKARTPPRLTTPAPARVPAGRRVRAARILAGGITTITSANKDGTFIMVAPGTFDLRDLNPKGAAKRPRSSADLRR
jgi:hypothetical protein